MIRHHVAASTALYLLGVLAAALYPALARRTFIDENAFLVAQTTVGFDRRDARDALERYRAAIDAARTSPGDVHRSDALRSWLEDELDALGMERYRQTFALDGHSWTRGDDRGRSSDASNDNATHGVNVHAVARAARGNGREGIVLATPIGAPGATLEADAAALALGLVVMRTIATAPWLAKDVAWLVADARWGPGDHGIAATDAWLREYHAPGSSGARGTGHRTGRRSTAVAMTPSPSSLAPFGRIGALQQAYVVELPEGAVADVASINVVGFNGALPNQDLVNVPVQLAKLAGFPSAGIFADSSRAGTGGGNKGDGDGGRGRVKGGDLFDALGAVVGSSGFAADLRRVAGFALALARGTPTGSHASFKSYAVDAVTVRVSGGGVPTGVPTGGAHRRGDPGRGVSGEDAFLRLGTFAESAVRCSNNLLETLHHSMFYYVMVDDDRFLSIAEYVAPQGLMLASSLVTAIALAVIGTSTSTGRSEPVSLDEKRRGKRRGKEAANAPTHDWSSALALALLAHVAGWCALLVATRTASTAAQLAAAYAGALVTAAAASATWSGAGMAGMGEKSNTFDGDEGDGDEGDGAVTRAPIEPPWAALKVVTLSVQVASLGALTFFNFALAVAVTAPLAPLQLAAHGGVGGAIPPRARAALTLVAAPVLLVATSCAALGTEAWTALGDAAVSHVAWGRRVHVLPLAWCVAWPGAVLAACVHLGGAAPRGGRVGGSTREEAQGGPEGKKRR